jgi:hypothetical protein
MAGFVKDTLRKAVSGAWVAGRQVGGRAAATAGPRIVSAVDAVRTRFTGPHAVAPAPPIPTKPQSAPSSAQHEVRAPNPASVAKNIAKHDPANDPVIPKRKPVKRSVPGARLPAHRKA